MSEEKKVPDNCFRCPYGHCCEAPYYGSSLCKFHREIDERCIEMTLKREKGG